MDIQYLLNPHSESNNDQRSAEVPVTAPILRVPPQLTSTQKRQKIPKDAPIFSQDSKSIGHVNYPPYETGINSHVAAQHIKFQMSPIGRIQQTSARHIPYNSDKKDFMEKTGRDAFEVFQYTYKVPGEEKLYVVLWDYQVGLVRITPFFKSCKYAKTIPARAMRENPGLLDVSYSITGGALICQGYWMPFQAAKALARTFCYDIRYALTPIFGNSFPASCVQPHDPNYGKFAIDPAIVKFVTSETDRFRADGASYQLLLDEDLAVPKPSTPFETPKMRFDSPSWVPKALRPRALPKTDRESESIPDDDSERYIFSPQISPRSQTWTPVNKSQSPMSPPSLSSSAFSSPINAPIPLRGPLPTSVPDQFWGENYRTKRLRSVPVMDEDVVMECESPPPSDMEEYRSAQSSHSCSDGAHTQEDLDAAEIILSLRGGGSVLPPPKRIRYESEN